MSIADWSLALGLLLLAMVLVNTGLRSLPLTSPMVYLAAGWILGPGVVDVLRPHPSNDAALLAGLAELGLLVSLFAVGMHLRAGWRDRRWRLPLKLAFVSLALMVAMVAAVGVLLLQLPLGIAIVLGAILAPTDPVLASALQPEEGDEAHPVSFTLAAEGGLNDGAAYPFVVLGFLVAGLVDRPLLDWLLVDFLWATLGGLAIGGALGTLVGRSVVYLRSRLGQALGLDVFLGLGLIGTAYGLAHLCAASGFLAVFAAGIALARVRDRPAPEAAVLETPPTSAGHSYETLAGHPRHASATMRGWVEDFIGQMERICEMGMVLLVGAMLPQAAVVPALWWFVPLMLVLLRPLSVLPAYIGERAGTTQVALAGWFGIRGIGSVFYLMLALRTGVGGPAADTLVSLTLWTIAASIVLHGLSARPLMRWSLARRAAQVQSPLGQHSPPR